MKITINNKISFSKESRPFIVAEISGNHGGNKKIFLKHIKEAHKNGADIIKIQVATSNKIEGMISYLEIFDEKSP